MWISHHGSHGKQSCRGIIVPNQRENPIVKGINNGDIWGPTDVYGVRLPSQLITKLLCLAKFLKA